MIKPQYYLSATCIIKNEAEYMPEWLEYHLIVGVQKFYIYDNGGTDNLKQVLQPYIDAGIVDYTYWPGIAMQMPAYRDCVNKHQNDTHWLAVIDIDEFLYSDTGNIRTDLEKFEDQAAVVLQWMVYGDSGRKTKQPGLVIERFKSHNLPNVTSEMCKSIINPRRIIVKNLHLPTAIDGYVAVNAIGEPIVPISNARLQNGTYANMHIKHYIFKSYEEYLIKRSKGDALSSKTARFRNEDTAWDAAYMEYNHNEVKNDISMDKYIDKVNSAITKRLLDTKDS